METLSQSPRVDLKVLDRYPVLRRIANRLKTIAKIIQVITVIIAAAIFLGSFSVANGNPLILFFAIPTAAIIGLGGFAIAEFLLAYAESILVVLDVEENTRISASQVLSTILIRGSLSSASSGISQYSQGSGFTKPQVTQVCPRCKAKYVTSEKFCSTCGARLMDV